MYKINSISSIKEITSFDQFAEIIAHPLSYISPEILFLLIGLIIILIGLILFSLKKKPSSKGATALPNSEILQYLKKNNAILDISYDKTAGATIGKAVIKKITTKSTSLEFIDSPDLSGIEPSAKLLLTFSPLKSESGKINSFCATVITGKIENNLFELSIPYDFAPISRRKFKRKKVLDQQFIRVKIWLGSSDSDDGTFADSAPIIAVNSYDPRSTGHEQNKVINISKAGLGIDIPSELVKNEIAVNNDILINLFIFNFKQKMFKPYWYAGQIKSIRSTDSDTCRIGISFEYTGSFTDETEQTIIWSPINS